MVALSGLALAAAAPAADPTLERRLQSFLAGGYDPLTVPVDWFDKEPVAGAPRALPVTPKLTDAVDRQALEAAAKWAENHASTALIVAKDGRIVFERYWHGDGRDTRFNPQSMSKTLIALLVGTAIDRGEIKSVDDPVGRYVREWRRDSRGRITIAQALQMASGLGQVDAGYGYAVTRENPAVAQHFGNDFVAPILALPLKNAPGAKFDYNNNAANLLVLVLQRATGKRYGALLSERLWRPLGLADAALYIDRPGGFPMASCCVFSRPIDWVPIGRLIADRGVVEGKRIVSASWIDAMTTPSSGNRGYGYQLWLGDQRVGRKPPERIGLIQWQSEPFAAKDLVFLLGHGQQRVWVMRDKGLVVVRAGRSWPADRDESALPNLIARGARS